MADERLTQFDPALVENWTHAGRCLRSVTHDVNNQLGAVLAYSELIGLELDGNAELQRMLDDIVRGVQESSALLDTLTALVSRDEEIVEEIDLSALLQRLAGLFRHEWKRMHLQTDLRIPEEPSRLLAVRVRLIRALVHALRYATEARRGVERGATLGIWLHATPEAYDLRIGTLSQDAAATQPLGDCPEPLAQARAYVEFHNGKLDVYPGDTIRITLPRDTGLQPGGG